MSLRSEKAALTREINSQKKYLAELEELKNEQGDRNYFSFEGKERPRWSRFGEYFFPKDIRREEDLLASLIHERQMLDLKFEENKKESVFCLKGKEIEAKALSAFDLLTPVERKMLNLKFEEDSKESVFCLKGKEVEGNRWNKWYKRNRRY